MKTPKATISLPCLAVLLATLATTPALHASQTNAQASASTSNASSQSASAIRPSTALSSSSSTSLTTGSINSDSSSSVATTKPEAPITIERFYQLISRSYECMRDNAIEPACHYFELTFCDTRNLQIQAAQKKQLIEAGTTLILKGQELMKQNHFTLALCCYESTYKMSKNYPHRLKEATNHLVSALISVGSETAKQGRIKEALPFYERAYELSKGCSDLHTRATVNLREALITIGSNCMVQDKPADAYLFFERAYRHGKSLSPQRQIMISVHIGKTLFDQNKHKNALPYFEEAYEIAHKHADESAIKGMANTIAGNLGNIYLADRGVAPDYRKAFNFLKQAHKSSIEFAKLNAANDLGTIYIHGLGREKDLLRARKYFDESFRGAIALHQTTPLQSILQSTVFAIWEKACHSLYLVKLLQLEQFDDFFESIQGNPTESLIEQASHLLAEAHTTQGIPPELDAPLEKQIAADQAKLKKLTVQLEQNLKQQQKQRRKEKRRAAHTKASPEEASSNQKVTEAQATAKAIMENEAKKSAAENAARVQIILKQAEVELEAYRNKPSVDTRYTKAKSLYLEALQLSRKKPEIRQKIMQRLDKLIELREQYQETSKNSESSNKTDKKREVQITPWTILDPNNLAQGQSAAKTRLQELATHPLQVLQTEKFQALSQTCSTRCGSGDRIMYVVLPSYHSVGIINIGPHSDYEKVELLRHREDWFLNPTPQAITIAIERAKKRNDEEQVKALTDFLQQIRAQGSSTDSKEAKEQKS